MNASEVFDKLRVLIDEACDQCSFQIAIRGAEALGMSGGQSKNRWALDYDFEHVDISGAKATFSFHSYDQSKAFSVRPDMNKFKVTLTDSAGLVTVHQNQYEG
jgi:hypothetical protein